MKGLSFAVALVLVSLLVKHGAIGELVLTAWPQSTHFYHGESIVLTCEVKGKVSEVSISIVFGHNVSTAATPRHAHRVNNNSFSISAVTAEDSGLYWCKSQKSGTKYTLSNSVSLNVTADSPSVSLKVHPENGPYLQGKTVELHCSARDGENKTWTLSRLRGPKVTNTTCAQMGGTVSAESPEMCIFNNVSSRMDGLYLCWHNGNQRSKTINITVTDNTEHHEEEEDSSGPWIWVLCAAVVILLLVPLILMLVPSVRQRIKFFPVKAPRMVGAQQEMPQTKQDVTEIQWDLAWMEMANLLDKQQYPGS